MSDAATSDTGEPRPVPDGNPQPGAPPPPPFNPRWDLIGDMERSPRRERERARKREEKRLRKLAKNGGNPARASSRSTRILDGIIEFVEDVVGSGRDDHK